MNKKSTDNKLRHYFFFNNKINSFKNNIHRSRWHNIAIHELLNSLQKTHNLL
jgi:hypothetical protein